MAIIAWLEKQSRPVLLGAGLALMSLIGLLDFLTGYEIAFSLFYLLPILLITWTLGSRLGTATSLASALIWYSADLTSGHPYSHPLIIYWNALVRLGFFLIVTLLLSTLKRELSKQRQMALTDYLTSAANTRNFTDRLQIEIDRAHRYNHPFTLGYMDLDDFKQVNDQYGHPVGNEVLRVVVHTIQGTLRKSDLVARLGGDEFAILLPETGPLEAKIAIARLHQLLLQVMRDHHWPVTFSFGVLSCANTPTCDAETVIKMADQLMYTAKNGGKNAVVYRTSPEG